MLTLMSGPALGGPAATVVLQVAAPPAASEECPLPPGSCQVLLASRCWRHLCRPRCVGPGSCLAWAPSGRAGFIRYLLHLCSLRDTRLRTGDTQPTRPCPAWGPQRRGRDPSTAAQCRGQECSARSAESLLQTSFKMRGRRENEPDSKPDRRGGPQAASEPPRPGDSSRRVEQEPHFASRFIKTQLFLTNVPYD